MIDKEVQSRVHIRATSTNEGKVLRGYAAVFDSISNPIYDHEGSYYEVLKAGCFDRVLADPGLDVVFNVNHDNNQMLARTSNKTLELWADSKGLGFKVKLPATQAARDLWELVREGTFNQCSFAFGITAEDNKENKWEDYEPGMPLRVINRVSRLYDVCVATRGAYSATSVDIRSYNQFIEERGQAQELDIIHISLQPGPPLNRRQLKMSRL